MKKKSLKDHILPTLGIALGAFLAATAIQVFLYPNKLIDGGVIGVSLILARLFGDKLLPLFLILLNLPFIYLAYHFIRKSFVLYMIFATLLFAFFLSITSHFSPFIADPLEVIVLGGILLGIGVGMIIRLGSCTDGTEILAIIINRKWGFTVGQVVLLANVFIFGIYGIIFSDWHIALQSMMTYIVAFKMLDIVILGLGEVKSVLILTSNPKKMTHLITHQMGLGLTVIPSIGGYTQKNREILFVIVERLDLAALKELVLQEDPYAFMAIEDLHEFASGKQAARISKRMRRKKPTVTVK